MDLGLKNKVVLVTGASRGIGASTVESLAHHGAIVIINYLQAKEKAEELLNKIKTNGAQGMVVQADVRVQNSVDNMVESVINEFGQIDVLVNNASISFPIKPFTALSWDEVESKINGELKALYYCSQAVLKDMLTRKSGKLIFISSGLSRQPGYGFSTHAAAKAAMDSMARVMAQELGPMGITVNVVGPGLTVTDATSGLPKEIKDQVGFSTPLKRLGLPEDIAKVILFLASSWSDFLTGEYIPVNGGSYMM